MKMSNYFRQCRICRGNCDPGELRGGVCPECEEREALRMAGERYAQQQRQKAEQLFTGCWEQMELRELMNV